MSEDVDLFTDRWDSTEFSRAVDHDPVGLFKASK
jgi:hypothetical protein